LVWKTGWIQTASR